MSQDWWIIFIVEFSIVCHQQLYKKISLIVNCFLALFFFQHHRPHKTSSHTWSFLFFNNPVSIVITHKNAKKSWTEKCTFDKKKIVKYCEKKVISRCFVCVFFCIIFSRFSKTAIFNDSNNSFTTWTEYIESCVTIIAMNGQIFLMLYIYLPNRFY